MIVDLDHIAVSTQNPAALTQILAKTGYVEIVAQKKAVNAAVKKQFLSQYNKEHDLALFKKQGSIGIEVINHYSSSGKQGIWSLDDGQEITRVEDLPDAFQGTALAVKTKDPAKTKKLFMLLGWKENHTPPKLVYTSLLTKQSYTLRIIHDQHAQSALDDEGFSCLALISTSPEKEHTLLREAGFSCTDIESVTVNNKLLSFFFVQGPSELVEIVGVSK